MSLIEELRGTRGRPRRFLLYRILDLDVEYARKLVGVPKGTYNSWLRDEKFVEIHRKRDNLSTDYKLEAMALLRRDTQLDAIMLEEDIIKKMREEVESGDYNLLRTNLAKTVYEKLMSDLDYSPKAIGVTWEQRFQNLFIQPEEHGEYIEAAPGGYIEEHIEANPVSEAEYSESNVPP